MASLDRTRHAKSIYLVFTLVDYKHKTVLTVQAISDGQPGKDAGDKLVTCSLHSRG